MIRVCRFSCRQPVPSHLTLRKMTIALCAGLEASGPLNTPVAIDGCVRTLTMSTAVALKKSAVVGFGGDLQHAIAKHNAVPKLMVYFKRLECAVAEAGNGKSLASTDCSVVVMSISYLVRDVD